jgi:hypothetical protein
LCWKNITSDGAHPVDQERSPVAKILGMWERRMRYTILEAAILCLGASAASIGAARAQDVSLSASFGDYTISAAGESHQIEVTAGGLTDAFELGGGCAGWIATAPDVQLDFKSSGAPLSFRVQSELDSTLVINTADSRWLCDDDSGGDFEPSITMENPLSGIYDIWVGAYDDSDTYIATLLTISQGINGPAATTSQDFNGPAATISQGINGPAAPRTWQEEVQQIADQPAEDFDFGDL